VVILSIISSYFNKLTEDGLEPKWNLTFYYNTLLSVPDVFTTFVTIDLVLLLYYFY